MGSRSNHSGGFWEDFKSGAEKLGAKVYDVTHGVKSKPKAKPKAEKKPEKKSKPEGSSYAQSVGKPMKDIGSAEDAVARLRKNRGGRLP